MRGTLPFQLEDLLSPTSPRGWGGEGRRGRASARPSRSRGGTLEVSRLEMGHERQGHWVGSCLKVTSPPEPCLLPGDQEPSREGSKRGKPAQNPRLSGPLWHERGGRTRGRGEELCSATWGLSSSEAVCSLQGARACCSQALTVHYLSYKKLFLKKGPNPAPVSPGSWGMDSSRALPVESTWSTPRLQEAVGGGVGRDGGAHLT